MRKINDNERLLRIQPSSKEKKVILPALLAMTWAARRHSMTRQLKYELAALFMGARLLATTKVPPGGNRTEVVCSGLNSISLAVPVNRGGSNTLTIHACKQGIVWHKNYEYMLAING